MNAIAISDRLVVAGLAKEVADAVASAIADHSDERNATKVETAQLDAKVENCVTKADFAELKTELKSDTAQLDAKIENRTTKEETVKLETKFDNHATKADIADLRESTKADLAEFKTEVRSEFARLDAKMDAEFERAKHERKVYFRIMGGIGVGILLLLAKIALAS